MLMKQNLVEIILHHALIFLVLGSAEWIQNQLQ